MRLLAIPGAPLPRWEKWGPASLLASVNEERAIRRFGLLAYITALGQLRRGDPEHGGYTCSVSRMGSCKLCVGSINNVSRFNVIHTLYSEWGRNSAVATVVVSVVLTYTLGGRHFHVREISSV